MEAIEMTSEIKQMVEEIYTRLREEYSYGSDKTMEKIKQDPQLYVVSFIVASHKRMQRTRSTLLHSTVHESLYENNLEKAWEILGRGKWIAPPPESNIVIVYPHGGSGYVEHLKSKKEVARKKKKPRKAA